MSTHPSHLSASSLRWKCDASKLSFETTKSVDPAQEVSGQEAAKEALTFGILCDAPGQNVYVRGSRGTGRLSMVRRLLKEIAPTTDLKRDRCYVHNFKKQDAPRVITLPPGTANQFRKKILALAEFVQEGLLKALDSDPYSTERDRLKESIEAKINEITQPLEEDLHKDGMTLATTQQGNTVIFPIVDGKPIPPEQLRALVAQGEVPEERWTQFRDAFPAHQKRLSDTGKIVSETMFEGGRQVQQLNQDAANDILTHFTQDLLKQYSDESIQRYVAEIIEDAVENRIAPTPPDRPGIDLKELYGVNIVLQHSDAHSRPVVEENNPSMMNLLGTVEPNFGPNGQAISDFRGIRAGALLKADGGYLILDAQDLLTEPGAWRSLIRTLRTGRLEIVPPEAGWMQPHMVIQPEPIEINVRVIIVGDVQTYYQLDRFDQDFSELFKVLADFENQMERTEKNAELYGAVVARLCKNESLPHFQNSAIAKLAEHGARIASSANKLTARFGRIADIAREAAFLAQQDNESIVVEEHVSSAIRRTKNRASMPSRRFQEMIEARTILLDTHGAVVGQINGLAVMQSGPLTYGFPARLTSTIGPGRAGLINIEGAAQMSGSIHTKGFYILGGLLRTLLKTQHPLAFSASIAFEQSYGGIDGDSASGAEMVCLISALTGIPIKQNYAMTGAVDQHGQVEAIGGVNEKIEGFFDACSHFGLTGDQGVIIPKSNAPDLMLREDVADACASGQFHVYAVQHIHEAIEITMGMPAGRFENGAYPPGTVLHQAVQRTAEFWKLTLASPEQLRYFTEHEEAQ